MPSSPMAEPVDELPEQLILRNVEAPKFTLKPDFAAIDKTSRPCRTVGSEGSLMTSRVSATLRIVPVDTRPRM